MWRKLFVGAFIGLLLFSSVLLNGFSTAGGTQTIYGPLRAGNIYVFIKDPDAAFQALLKGDVDMMGLTRPEQVDQAIDAGFTIIREEAMGLYNSFWPNFARNITNDVNFRKAIAHLLPKEELIATYYGPLGKYAVSFLGPAYGKWHNPNIEDFTEYDPELAKYILSRAGYTIDPSTGKRIDPATGKPMRPIQLVYPSDFMTYREWALRYAQEMENVGIPVQLIPAPFSTGEWWEKALSGDFDIIQIGWSWTGYPWILYVWFYSGSPPEWLNIQRYSNPEYDKCMEIFVSSLNETEVIQAVWRAQEIIAEDVAYIPGIYSVAHTAVNPEWTGMIEAPWGSYMEALRIRRKDGDLTKFLRIHVDEDPATMVLGYDPYAIADVYVDLITCNVPFESHPFRGPVMSFVITNWVFEPWSDPELGVVNGTKLILTLRKGLKWHDGRAFTADDYAFALKYMRDKQVPRGSQAYNALIDAVAVSDTVVELYYNRTGIFILEDQYYVLAFPKHIYNDDVTRYGEPAGPMGLQFPDRYGVPDPSQFYAYNTKNPYNSSLTCFIGIGPFIFLPGGWQPQVSFTVVANRQFFMAVLTTDLDFDFKVNIKDIFAVALHYGAVKGTPKYTINLDVNNDGIINDLDMQETIKNFGQKAL